MEYFKDRPVQSKKEVSIGQQNIITHLVYGSKT